MGEAGRASREFCRHGMRRLILGILLLALLGCSSRPFAVPPAYAAGGAADHRIYVVNHGWHTGIVVPAPPLQKAIPELERRFADSPYLEFGWGDEKFYQSGEFTSGLALRAIFWPTASVVYAASVPSGADEYFKHSAVETLCLNDEELSSLVAFISSSFHREDNGRVVALEKALSESSRLYRGVGDYYLLNTCNSWTAKALKSAGMDISTFFKLTAPSVMDATREEASAGDCI